MRLRARRDARSLVRSRKNASPDRWSVRYASRKAHATSAGTTFPHSLSAAPTRSTVVRSRSQSSSVRIESGSPGVRIFRTSFTTSRARYLSSARAERRPSSSSGLGTGTPSSRSVGSRKARSIGRW